MGVKAESIPFIPQMLHWRGLMWRAVFVLVVLGAVMCLGPMIGLWPSLPPVRTVLVVCLWALLSAGGVLWLVSVILMLRYMFLAAGSAGGARYAVRQLLLAVALTPVLTLGPILVPLLVRADILAWLRHEQSHHPPDQAK